VYSALQRREREKQLEVAKQDAVDGESFSQANRPHLENAYAMGFPAPPGEEDPIAVRAPPKSMARQATIGAGLTIAKPPDEEESEEEEEELYLALHATSKWADPDAEWAECEEAPEPVERIKKRRASVAGGGADSGSPEGKANIELPVLMLRIVTTEETCPVDLSFLSAFADRGESLYPPGVYFEQRKESVEFWEGEDGERHDCKSVEVSPHLVRTSGMGKGKAKDDK